jgi:hypothetical protein
LFMRNLKGLIEDGVRAAGTYDTYRDHLDKNVLPRIGEVWFFEANIPLVNKTIFGIKDEVMSRCQ